MKELFLAYAVQDRDRAYAIRDFLTRQGLILWDDSRLQVGSGWRLSILDRLRDAAAIVVLATPSAKSSEWVNREIQYGLTSGTPIIPVLLEGDPLPALSSLQHARANDDGSLPKEVIERLREIAGASTKGGSATARLLLEALSKRTISSVLEEVQKSLVLLLGNFSDPNIERLSLLQAALERRGFHPVIFNFAPPAYADLGETIRLLAGLAGFVVAEMSERRSVAMELQLLAHQLSVPIVPVIAKDQEPLALFRDFIGKYDWVLPPRVYEDINSLVKNLDEVIIVPAQRKREELAHRKAASGWLVHS